MPPVVNRLRRQVVTAPDDAGMFAQDVALGRHDQPVGIDSQADRPVREGRRDAVAISLETTGNGISADCSSAQTSAMVPDCLPCGV